MFGIRELLPCLGYELLFRVAEEFAQGRIHPSVAAVGGDDRDADGRVLESGAKDFALFEQ
jgi:hypothetical protein